ncbi:52_t:CDS:2, partial [Racocetra persica]
DVSVIIRLTQQGTQFYLDSSSSDQSNFVKNMGSDIAKVINCDVSRITIPTHYQYSNTDDKIFMRINIAQNVPSGQDDQEDSRSAPSLANDLNELIINKDISVISTGDTSKYIDQYNGAWQIPNLLDKYKFILIGVFVALVLLLLLLWYLISRGCYREDDLKQKSRKRAILNLMTVFVPTLILVDLILDILFIVFNRKDEKWIMPVSRELRENEQYKMWWQAHRELR